MRDLLMHTIASLMIRFGVYGLPGEGGEAEVALNKLGYPGHALRGMLQRRRTNAPSAKMNIKF